MAQMQETWNHVADLWWCLYTLCSIVVNKILEYNITNTCTVVCTCRKVINTYQISFTDVAKDFTTCIAYAYTCK